MRVSVSKIKTYLTCQKRYDFKYNKGLRRKNQKVSAKVMGKIIHHLIDHALQIYWESDVTSTTPPDLKQIREMLQIELDKWERENKELYKPEIELLELDDMPVVIEHDENFESNWQESMEGSLEVVMELLRNLDVPNKWQVLTHEGQPLLEFELNLEKDGIEFIGIVDAVMKEKDTGLIHIIDWKTRASFTDYTQEVIDMQIPVYMHVLKDLGITVDVATIYQIKQKAPSIPALNKDGTTSRRYIATTWGVYEASLIANGENPEDYIEEMKPKLSNVEFFKPTTFKVGLDTASILWDNMVNVANQAEAMSSPSGVYGYPCRFCTYKEICFAQIAGYDVEDLVSMLYDTVEKEEDATKD